MCMTCSIRLERSSLPVLQTLDQPGSSQVPSVVIPDAWSIHGEAGIVLCSSDSIGSFVSQGPVRGDNWRVSSIIMTRLCRLDRL